MSMEIKQHLRMDQRLVMTPQLQQAIKLLQLSRMELADVVREEMMEHPVLEAAAETAQEQEREPSPEAAAEQSLAGETELPAQEMERRDTEKEVTADGAATSEIDWDSYLENYSAAPQMPSYKPSGEELPSLESTLTRKTTLFEHLVWQLKLSNVPEAEERVGMLIIGNLDIAGYLKEPPLCDIAEEAEVPQELAEKVLSLIQLFDPVGVAARSLEECLLVQARHLGV